MSEIEAGGFPDLANVMTRLDPKGEMAHVVNVLSRKKPMLSHIPWQEGNLATGHQITQTDTSLPSAEWRRLNRGVAATKGQTVQYTESCGHLEDESKIDELTLKLNGGAAWRETEDAIKTEGLSQQLATSIIYESVSSNPERIHGLTPRYPATSGYDSSSYVFAGTNAGVNCRSIWLINWAPRKLYGIYPPGTMAGLQKVDRGRHRVTDGDGKGFFAWITTLMWDCGIAVEDYRYAVRFQWDPDDAEMAASEKGIYLKMQDMLDQVYDLDASHARFYMDRTSKMRLNAQLASNDARLLETAQVGDHRLQAFGGVPIFLDDSLVAETAIS